jgi:uncharacterized protein (TIGR03083 family)
VSDSPWPLIHAERRALLNDLRGLPASSWSTPSLCSEWTVLDALGHIVATTKINPPKFFAAFAGAGFNFGKFSAKGIARETAEGPEHTLAEFERHLEDSTAPPGPSDTALGEIVVHSADIRRPLAITHHKYDPEALTRAAGFYAKTNLLIGSKSRISGLALTATDLDWSLGSGPPVSGPMLSLVLAMTGRKAAFADLAGDGVRILHQRG